MNAKSIAKHKEIRDDGSIVEIVIWELPEPLPPCHHRFKYRLAYVVSNECVVRYDNERGKGDHRHVGSNEMEYDFRDLSALINDFQSDVEAWK